MRCAPGSLPVPHWTWSIPNRCRPATRCGTCPAWSSPRTAPVTWWGGATSWSGCSPRTSTAGDRDDRCTTSSTRHWDTYQGADVELTEMSAVELVTAYAAVELSPVEVTTAVLDRIEEQDEALNAYCLVDREAALAQAKESEARWRTSYAKGLLDGVPISIKDVYLTKGWPTLRGSRAIDPAGP